MKKYLFLPVLLILMSFSFPAKRDVSDIKPTKTKAALFTQVLRFTVPDDNAEYTVYVYAEPTYTGDFCCGNVTLQIVNDITSDVFSPTSQLGTITLTDVTGKARFRDNGVNKEIFF